MRRLKPFPGLKTGAMLAAALMLAACTNDDIGESPNPNSDTAVQLSAGIGGDAPQRGSHAAPETRASDASWHAGDAIGLYMLEANTNNISRGMANRRYINAATGSTANFAPDGEANTAWYPSGGDEVDLIAYYPHAAGQSASSGSLAVDVSNQSSLPAIDLMTSNLSQGHSSAEDKRTAKLTFAHRLSKIVLNLKKGEGTDWLNLAEAKVTISGTPATAVWNLYKGEFESYGEIADVELNMMGGRTTAIVIPPAGESPETGSDAVTFTVTVGAEQFVATLPADKPLGSGKQLDLTIRLDYTQPVIEAEITDWIGGTEIEIPALTINLPAGPSGQPAVQTFNLWRTAEPNDIRTYSWNDDSGKWTATPAPFYIENLTKGETFQARYTLSTDPLTAVDDVIETVVTELKEDYTLELKFTHANAQVELNLSAGTGFPVVDWSQAAVKILGYEQVLSGASHTFIMTPGEIAAGTTLATIGIEGVDYGAVVKEAIKLDAGITAKVAIELQPTQSGMIVTYEPWLTVKIDDLTAVNIATPTFGNAPNLPVSSIILTNQQIGSTSTYTWNGSKWNHTGGEKLYVENITGNTFKAHAVITEDNVTQVKDIIETEAVGLVSNTLTFAFTHTNAKLGISLAAGTDFPTSIDLSQADVYLLNYPDKFTDDTYYELIMTPGTNIAPGTQIARVEIGGQTYTASAATEIKLTAGTFTTVAVKLSPTESGIKVTYKSWDTFEEDDLTAVNVKTPQFGNATTATEMTITNTNTDFPSIYEWKLGTWSHKSGPVLYVENMSGATFTARAVLSKDDVTEEEDILVAPAVGLSSNALTFEFTHTNAKLNIILAHGENFNTAIDLNDAELYLLDYPKKRTGKTVHEYIMPAGTSITSGTQLAKVVVAGQTYTASATSNIPLTAGTETTVTVKLSGTAAGIDVKVNPWTEMGNTNLTAVSLTTPSHSDPNSIGTIQLWKTTDAGNKVTYQFSGGKWGVTGGRPFYLEEIASGDKFLASTSTILSTDLVTGLTDDLEMLTPVGVVNNALALTFTHAKARFTIDLRPGVFTETQLKAATVTLALNNDDAKPSSGKLQHDFIVTPGTTIITGQLLATIQVANINYELKAASDFTLAKHQHTTVSAIINGTGVGMNITVGTWGTGSGTGTITNTDVTQGSDVSKLPGKGAVTIQSADHPDATYRYEGGSSLVSQSNPLYWENYLKYSTGTTLAKYDFTFRFVPDDETGIAKDILYKTATTEWGKQIDLKDLLHENTEIVVVLEKGASYGTTDPDWANATVKLTGFGPDYTMTKKPTSPNLETNPVVVPKGLLSSEKYVKLTLNGVEYKAQLSDLNNIPPTLEGGKSYRLELTLEKTQIGVGSVTIKDFETVTGTGGIGYN